MNPLLIGAVVRHALSVFGGYFVASGVASQSEWEAIGGGVAALVAVGMSFVNKQRVARK